MKKTKAVIRYGLFFGIFLGIFLVLTLLFYPKNNTLEAGVPERDINLSGIFGAPEDSVDVIVLGDSVSYTSVSPLQMWDEQGVASYVCAQSGQRVTESYYWLKQIYEYQAPELLVVEANVLYNYERLEKDLDYALGEQLKYYLPFAKYHDRWKNLNKEDWNFSYATSRRDFARGFVEKIGVQPYMGGIYMNQTAEKEELAWVSEFYLDAIHRLCEKNGTELVIVSIPSPRNWNSERHNGVAEYAKEKDITYLDMNLCTEELGIDWSTDTLDAGDHMNSTGAEKVTTYLGAWLKEEFALEDHRGEAAYQVWDSNSDVYEE